MNLGRQYQLIISGLLILVVGALSLSLSIWFRNSAETVAHSTDRTMRNAMVEQIEARGRAVASSVSRYLVNPVYEFDLEAIREILETTAAEPDLLYAVVYDELGHILHDGKEHIPGFGEAPEAPVDAIAARAEGLLVQRLGDRLDISAPIGEGDLHGGRIQIGVSLAQSETVVAELQEQLDVTLSATKTRNQIAVLLVSIFLMLVGVVVASYAARRLTRPIRELQRYAQRMADGSFDQRIDMQREDELGDLADAFRGLGRSLTEYQTAVNEREQSLREQAEDLRHARDQAEAANRLKSEFLANMSHEIRTPMNGVLGMTQLLMQSALNARQSRFVESLRSSAESLMGIINDILDFSKIEAGRMEIESVRFDLISLVEDVVALFYEEVRAKGVRLYDELPQAAQLTVHGDPLRLKQVLTNLVSNAVKFTREGEIRLRLAPVSNRPGYWRFEILDTGIGMDEAACASVFDVFTQADASTTREFGGTGLGLGICSQLVQLMDGEIGVESQPGRGSCFHVELPLVVDAKPQPDAPLRGSLLVVIPDARRSGYLVSYLRARGLECDHQTDWQGHIDHRRYDAVLLDEQVLTPEWRPALGGVPAAIVLDRELEVADGGDGVELLVEPLRRADVDDCVRRLLNAEQHERDEIREATQAGGRILVVEDNPVNQEVAASFLRDFGYQVVLAGNGAEALARLEESDVLAVLMDCQMPVMDGFEATARLRRDPRFSELPVIALTANATEEDRRRCISVGMNDFITKPFVAEELRARVAACVQREETHVGHPVLDEGRLARLRGLQLPGRPDMVSRAAESFLVGTPELLNRLRRGIEEERYDELIDDAQSLRSSCVSVGSAALPELLDQLCDAARSQTPADVEDCFVQLERANLELRDALGGLVQKKAPAGEPAGAR